jgi:hypothetical protein
MNNTEIKKEIRELYYNAKMYSIQKDDNKVRCCLSRIDFLDSLLPYERQEY